MHTDRPTRPPTSSPGPRHTSTAGLGLCPCIPVHYLSSGGTSEPSNRPCGLLTAYAPYRHSPHLPHPVMSICHGRWKDVHSFSSEKNDPTNTMSDRLYEAIMERQSHRLDDQRSELGGRPRSCSDLPECLPNEVSELIITLSSGRIDSQRASLKPLRSESDLRAAADGPPRCASASAAVDLG